MENIFRELKQRYISKKTDLADKLEPQKYWFFEMLLLSKPKKSEEYIEHQLELYDEFVVEIIALQNLRKKEISHQEWSRLILFLKLSSEKVSARVDIMGYATALCSIFAGISIILAKVWFLIFLVPFAIFTWLAYQIHVYRAQLRGDAAANREMLVIFEEYLKNQN